MTGLSIVYSSEVIEKELLNSGTTEVKTNLSGNVFFSIKSKNISDEFSQRHLLIEKKSDICQGEPVIQGTRISVANIVELYHLLNWDFQKIQAEYPHLTAEQIYAALDYYDSHTKEIDAYLQEEKEIDG